MFFFIKTYNILLIKMMTVMIGKNIVYFDEDRIEWFYALQQIIA